MADQWHYDQSKPRTFLRSIEGEYGLKHELERLRSLPRVRKGSEIPFSGGPHVYDKHYLEPSDGLGQTLHVHTEDFSPGGENQKHGHVNEAVFYILDGRGYEIHDEVRYDWEAGDIVVVPNNCVHQHFNSDPEKPARAVTLKTKPMYLFMNMLFQKSVSPQPKEPTPGGKNFKPRNDETP